MHHLTRESPLYRPHKKEACLKVYILQRNSYICYMPKYFSKTLQNILKIMSICKTCFPCLSSASDVESNRGPSTTTIQPTAPPSCCTPTRHSRLPTADTGSTYIFNSIPNERSHSMSSSPVKRSSRHSASSGEVESIIERATSRYNETLFVYLQPTIEGVQHLIRNQASHEERMNRSDERMIEQFNEIAGLKELVCSLSHVELISETAETEMQYVNAGSQTVSHTNEHSQTENYLLPAYNARQNYLIPTSIPRQNYLLPAYNARQNYLLPAYNARQNYLIPTSIPRQK